MRLGRTLVAAAIILSTAGVQPTHAMVMSGKVVPAQRQLSARALERKEEERAEERAAIKYRRQFHRRTRAAGAVDTSTFQRDLPHWYSTRLLEWRGMTLSRPAMKAYYDASMEVGHYIGGAGYRSHATQAGMSSSLAAPAGYSYHEVGLAADIFGLSSEEQHALEKQGFNQLDSEYWHYSFRVYG